jgi:hypothetical protein
MATDNSPDRRPGQGSDGGGCGCINKQVSSGTSAFLRSWRQRSTAVAVGSQLVPKELLTHVVYTTVSISLEFCAAAYLYSVGRRSPHAPDASTEREERSVAARLFMPEPAAPTTSDRLGPRLGASP